MFLWLIFAVFLLSFLYVLSCQLSDHNAPPGIRGFAAIPFIARLVTENTNAFSKSMLERFGDIASLQLLNIRTMIFIGNHDLLKEAYTKQELADRPITIIKHGLVSPNGRLWKEQRRFALSTLRDFGMGKNAQESRIIHECEDLLKEFKKQEKAFDPKFFIGCAVTNVICATIFSDRFEYGDPTLQRFFECISDNLTTPRQSFFAILPLLRYLPGQKKTFDKFLRNREFVSNIVRKYVKEHQDTYTEGDIRDYIDAYIASMIKEKDDEDSTFTQEQLIRSVHDLFVAGSETTGTTLRWALALMALNPDVQNKVHEEIDAVIGRDRIPNSADRINMAVTDAVLFEVQRYGSVVPLILHRANTATTLGGYTVQKGDIVVADVQKMNTDPRVWPHPHQFNINNFYKDGKVVNRNFFITFSVGKRSCLGESLAKMETFLFFVTLMQNFRFSFNEGEEPDLSKPCMGIIRAPPEYEICVDSR